MSRIFDWLFPPQNRHHEVRPYDQEARVEDPFIHPRGLFAEIDRIMQGMMQEHFQSMNLHFAPHQHNLQIEDKSDEELHIRDRMLKKPDRDYSQLRREPHLSSPNKDINLDNAIQENPNLIDHLFQDSTTHPTPHTNQDVTPFLHRFSPFSPDVRDKSGGNYNFSSQTMVVTRGSDGQVKYHKREIREDSDGNRQVFESSSDDKDNAGGQYLQDDGRVMPEQRIRLSPGIGASSQDGVYQMIKRWFYPPKDD